MRPAVRVALAAATTVALSLPLGPVPGAVARVVTADPSPTAPTGAAGRGTDPAPGHSKDVPSQARVDKARAEVAIKQQGVAQLESALAAASATLEAASSSAEAAAERYNGAMWRLDEARRAARHAQRHARRAAASVDAQRAGIVTLVTDSYQNGTELSSATAMMSDEGPTGLMSRYAVVQSAGDSMQARYGAFKTASAQAKQYVVKAGQAQDRQKALAADAKKLAVAAGAAASAAGEAANRISVQKQQLLQAVASAQNISLGLATRRHDALERIAQEKAAQAARAKEQAEQKALRKAAREAKKKAAAAQPVNQPDGGVGTSVAGATTSIPMPTPAPPPVANPAPNQSVAVQRTIDYAKQQLGKPYLWAASGPGSFDCSGLTMMAWARGGVSLPHYSVAQFEQSTRVSMADARPGDLLFWSNNGSPSGIHHVALYLGGGKFIEAPHTGAFVRYNSIYDWYPDFVARP